MMDQQKSGDAWYVLYVAPQMERHVMERIVRLVDGSKVFLPLRKVETIRRGKKRVTSHVIFPNYLFFGADDEDRHWLRLREIEDVLGVLGCDGTPFKLRDGVLDAVIALCDKPASWPHAAPGFRIGDRVRITDGAFASFNAEIEKLGDKIQVKLAACLFGRDTPLTLELDQIEKLG